MWTGRETKKHKLEIKTGICDEDEFSLGNNFRFIVSKLQSSFVFTWSWFSFDSKLLLIKYEEIKQKTHRLTSFLI